MSLAGYAFCEVIADVEGAQPVLINVMDKEGNPVKDARVTIKSSRLDHVASDYSDPYSKYAMLARQARDTDILGKAVVYFWGRGSTVHEKDGAWRQIIHLDGTLIVEAHGYVSMSMDAAAVFGASNVSLGPNMALSYTVELKKEGAVKPEKQQ